MLNNFFNINSPFIKYTNEQLKLALKTSKHICNVLYEPNELSKDKIEGVTFENVSFSKTKITDCTFIECHFEDCLFIGTKLMSVKFHDCLFKNCNFFESSFEDVYAKPYQFRNAITNDKFSNIAVHLYHQLRENYYQSSQREYKNEAEYYFSHWNRKNNYMQIQRKKKPLYRHLPKHLASWLYGYLFGYGYRARNFVCTTIIFLITAGYINFTFFEHLFPEQPAPSLVKVIYFTLTTMATLGSGYTPETETGRLLIIANVIFGISLLSATISAIFKKVIR